MGVRLEVLFVEDSETDTKLMLRELRGSGFSPRWQRVETAATLRDALSRRQWQLVISDSSVPRLGAIKALELTRRMVPGVPFIVVSGTISETAVVEVLRRGAADYITKENLQRLGPAVVRELHGPRVAPEQETERRRIARALHDQLGPLLTALKLNLETAQQRRGAARAQWLHEAASLADQSLLRLRDFAVELWPTVLDDLGLPAALRWLAERHERWGKFAVRLEVEEMGRLPFAVESAAFRIAQEALTNVARHSAAREAAIMLRASGGWVAMTVRDDGRGFELAAARAGPSLGLSGMQERAALAGGQLEIDSAPGRGTTVRARFPAPVAR
jgi:signal transduction histidine kinase